MYACKNAYKLYMYIYTLDLRMTPSGVMLHGCELVARILAWKLKENPAKSIYSCIDLL